MTTPRWRGALGTRPGPWTHRRCVRQRRQRLQLGHHRSKRGRRRFDHPVRPTGLRREQDPHRGLRPVPRRRRASTSRCSPPAGSATRSTPDWRTTTSTSSSTTRAAPTRFLDPEATPSADSEETYDGARPGSSRPNDLVAYDYAEAEDANALVALEVVGRGQRRHHHLGPGRHRRRQARRGGGLPGAGGLPARLPGRLRARLLRVRRARVRPAAHRGPPGR